MSKDKPLAETNESGSPGATDANNIDCYDEFLYDEFLRLLQDAGQRQRASAEANDSEIGATLATPVSFDMVEESFNKAKARVAAGRVDAGSTVMRMTSTTDTLAVNASSAAQRSPEFLELLESLSKVQQDQCLKWSQNYRKKKVIGRGGQGVVYLTECIDQNHHPKVLKVLSPEPYNDVESYEEDMRRMQEVFSLVYSMQVDNLVMVEDFAEKDGISMMTMCWIDGCDLATLLMPGLLDELKGHVKEGFLKHLNKSVITNRGTMGVQSRLKPGMAVNIIEKCLRALDALHSQGIVHGDIKPANIMLDRYGSIRLVDIGSAFQQSARPTRHTWTPRYAPPEFFVEDGEWTPQGDLASLGYVLIEMLSGRPPIAGPDEESVATRLLGSEWDQQLMIEKLQLPNRLEELMPKEVQESEHLMDILRKLIAPYPENRFATAEEALIGDSGTYQFMQGLARMHLAAPFSHEIRRWIEAVLQVRPTLN